LKWLPGENRYCVFVAGFVATSSFSCLAGLFLKKITLFLYLQAILHAVELQSRNQKMDSKWLLLAII
jgi:hypothetical protein